MQKNSPLENMARVLENPRQVGEERVGLGTLGFSHPHWDWEVRATPTSLNGQAVGRLIRHKTRGRYGYTIMKARRTGLNYLEFLGRAGGFRIGTFPRSWSFYPNSLNRKQRAKLQGMKRR